MDNFKLNGIGKFNGGEFYDVTVNGIGTLNGDLNSENLIINGMFTSKGEIKAKNKIDINGSSKFEKTVKCHELELNGTAKFLESVEVEKASINGFLTVEKELSVGDIEISSASFSIRELHADKIFIKDLHKIRAFNTLYEIGEIECTEIEANSLKCKKISASVVKLGKNAEVDLVEYSDYVDIDPRANIKEVRKV